MAWTSARWRRACDGSKTQCRPTASPTIVASARSRRLLQSQLHHLLSQQHLLQSQQHHLLQSQQHHLLSQQHHLLQSQQQHLLSQQQHLLQSQQHHLLSQQQVARLCLCTPALQRLRARVRRSGESTVCWRQRRIR
jgi:hypothetical protein|tara:strand:+ start:1632 stop:2039 length:408 start_codon:yes stop_codon:yes gene_type:complete